MLSARLDGESSPGEEIAADDHMASCADCADWFEQAARLTRISRTSVLPDAAPDHLLDAVLAAAPGAGWRRGGTALRTLLGLLGFGQFVLGIGQIASLGMAHGVGEAGGITSHHLLHESASWNVAIGGAYLWIALRRGRPSGALPMLTVFVGVLLLLSISDLLSGEVVVSALATHAMVAAGYVILLALRHPGFDAVTPPGARQWRLRLDDESISEQTARPVAAEPERNRGATARVRRRRAA